MDVMLDEVETRVLGCLIEKELTTPEYYPLSLNALTTACNQKSNRDPVMALDDDLVVRALEGLRFKQLAVVAADGGRVPKYRHIMAEKLQLVPAELALLCELLVRGPQTVGELRTRAERMHPFPDTTAVEAVLRELVERDQPLVTRLPRQAGRKEPRHAHLLSGMPELDPEQSAAPEPARLRMMNENGRIAQLEADLSSLRDEVALLRQMMDEFKRQFE